MTGNATAAGITTVDTEVLIVGGGGCGLAASVFLADAGVHAYLVERHPGTALMPKAHILNVRTMEILGQHGLADEAYGEGATQEENSAMRWLTSLAGDEPWDRKEIHGVDAWGGGELRAQYAALSAFRHGNLPQKQLEPLLRRHAEERSPGQVHFHHELRALKQNESGVRAIILDRDSGEEYAVNARYVVGADGGKTLGALLGIGMIGPEPFVHTISAYFRADLSAYLPTGDACVRSFIRPNPDGGWTRTGLIAMGPDSWGKDSREWVATITLTPEQEFADFDEAAVADAVRERLNIADLPLEIIRFTRWKVEGVYAERYREGNVFLAGDAAHRHSPMGGLGLNSGIQDAHNLSWKLAAVVRGHADADLLDSYEAERRPVAIRNVEFATFAFFNHFTAVSGFGMVPGAPASYNREVLERLFSDTPDGATRRVRLHETFDVLRLESRAAELELGFDYAESPTIVPDGTPPPDRDPALNRYVPVARPGHRMPHAWLEIDGVRRSTHHLLRPGRFLLITGSAADEWERAALETAAPIDVIAVGRDAVDPEGAWAAARGHADGGAVLIRPDGHVAFRGFEVGDAENLVDAIARALGSRTEVAA